jgi:hypothetical protein
MTAATSPDAPSCSAGIEAMNGAVNEITVLTVGSGTRPRTARSRWPATNSITTAIAIAEAKSPSAPPSDTAEPAIAVRRSTSAVASLRRLSPSSTVMIRPVTPMRRAIEVATASVG